MVVGISFGKDDQMPPGPHSIDDAKIRARCASPEAADYTLYVRGLINGSDVPGGQAEILRLAADRGLLPNRYTRQTLSEHLSGRYRHGPPWPTTEMIIECLPDRVPKMRIRDECWALFRAACHQARRSQNGADLIWLGTTASGARWERYPNSVSGRHAGPDSHRPPNAARVTGGAQPGGNVAGAGHRLPAYRTGPDADAAAEIADLRAECARLTVQLALVLALARDRQPGVDPVHYTDLSRAFARHQRSQLGQLADHIEPTAPLMRRVLARYLCAYAELGGTRVNELAVRTTLGVDVVEDVLAARRMPTAHELQRISAVLGADGDMVRHLADHARAEARAQGAGPTVDGRLP